MGFRLLIYFVFEEVYGVYEAAFSGGHDHIYGVEVFLAIEASGQVGLRIDSRMKIPTQGASEAQESVCGSHFHIQEGGYDLIDGDMVSEHS